MRTGTCFEFMSRRRHFWLASVVVIALGLIANILMGTRMDIRFTGGTMLRYSYPESGIVSQTEVPVSTVPAEVSDSEVKNTPPEPAQVPVIISGTDISGSDVSGGDVQESLHSGDDAEETVSASDPVSGSDAVSEGDVSVTDGIEPDYSTNVIPADAERIISRAMGENASVLISTDPAASSGGENKRLTITFDRYLDSGEESDRLIRQVMEAKYPNVSLTLRETSSVDPAAGGELLGRCFVAIGLAVLFMMLYVGVRFRQMGGWTAALSAIIAVLHDCLVAYFAFVIFRFPIDDNFVAVMLALIGLSLNSTIVIFDRIRENRRLLEGSRTLAQIADRSINESLGRTMCTDLCVFIAVAVLALVCAVSGLSSVLSFAVPMMFGVAFGCYSSLCIAGTVWVSLQELLETRRKTEE